MNKTKITKLAIAYIFFAINAITTLYFIYGYIWFSTNTQPNGRIWLSVGMSFVSSIIVSYISDSK